MRAKQVHETLSTVHSCKLCRIPTSSC